MVIVTVMVKIDDQDGIIIPKEIRDRRKLIGEVEIKEIIEGIIIIAKKTLKWKDFFKNKLKINWDKVQKLDLSNENLDYVWK
jgi:bifunctional DNA-binding transcriptional regulator/antitoxin component of YhaV-PrlF toxin-antitoxin module